MGVTYTERPWCSTIRYRQTYPQRFQGDRASVCIRTGAESAWRIAEKETIEKKRTEDVIDFPGEIVTTSECDYSQVDRQKKNKKFIHANVLLSSVIITFRFVSRV